MRMMPCVVCWEGVLGEFELGVGVGEMKGMHSTQIRNANEIQESPTSRQHTSERIKLCTQQSSSIICDADAEGKGKGKGKMKNGEGRRALSVSQGSFVSISKSGKILVQECRFVQYQQSEINYHQFTINRLAVFCRAFEEWSIEIGLIGLDWIGFELI